MTQHHDIMAIKLLTVVSVLHAASALSDYTISLAVDGMTLRKSDIKNECQSGSISDVNVNIGYKYADFTRCDFTESAYYPMEDTATSRRLISYQNTSSQQFSDCLQDPNCHSVDFNEWKVLIKRLYKACFYCYKTRDGVCTSQTVTNYENRTALYPIMDTMFVYAKIICNVTSEGFVKIPIKYRTRNQPYLTNISEKIACPLDHSIKILSVTQQADDLRVHMTADPKTPLNEILRKSLQAETDPETTELPVESLTVFGGYWWGELFRSRKRPNSLLVAFECQTVINDYPELVHNHTNHNVIRVGTVKDKTTQAHTGSTKQTYILFIIFSCLAALLVASIAIILTIILIRRKQTHHTEQNAEKEPHKMSQTPNGFERENSSKSGMGGIQTV